MYKLVDLDNKRNNNFDFIRFFAASLVIFSHCYAVSISHASFEPLILLTKEFISGGRLSVDVFFVVSGYLITRSMFIRNDLLAFIEARFLRLVPALLVSSFLTAFILGPILSAWDPVKYFSSLGPYKYLSNALAIHMFGELPGVFLTNPLPKVVNASLWTLPVEVKMYFIVLMIGIVTKWIKPKQGYLLGIILMLILAIVGWIKSDLHILKETESAARIIPYFMVGGIIYLIRSKVPISLRLVFILSVITIILSKSIVFKPVFTIFVSYLVIVFAYHPIFRFLNSFASHGDFSYGLYIYAFPIQQSVILIDESMSIFQLFTISYVITLICSIASWHLLEKKALSLKGKLFNLKFKKVQQADC